MSNLRKYQFNIIQYKRRGKISGTKDVYYDIVSTDYTSYPVSIRHKNLLKGLLILLRVFNSYLRTIRENEIGFKDIEIVSLKTKYYNYKNFKNGKEKRTASK